MDEMTNRVKVNSNIKVNTQQHVAGRPHYNKGTATNLRRGMPPKQPTTLNRKSQNNKPRFSNPQRSESIVKILDKIVSVCIFMLFFGLPLFFMNVTYQGIAFEKQYYFYFWVFVGVIAWALRGVLGGKMEIRRTSLDIPIGVFWLVCVLATVFSVDKYHSVFGFFGNPVNGLISITAIILAYYLIVSYIDQNKVKLIWWATVVSGGIVVVWSFLVTMGFIPRTILQHITPSLTGSFVSLAAFIAMVLPLFIVSLSVISEETMVSWKGKVITAGLFIVTILDVITLSLLFGYVRWYVVIAVIAFLLVFIISGTVKTTQKTSALAVVVFLLLVGFLIFDQPIFSRTQIQPETSLKYGLSFDIAKEAMKNKPFLGSGPGTYGYDFSLYRPKELNKLGRYDMRFYSDRGVLSESVSTIGIIGAIALIVAFLTYISTAIHAFMRSKDDDIRAISIGLFTTSIMAMLFSIFWSVNGMIILYTILIASLAVGVLRGSASDGSDDKLVLSMSSSPQNALSFAFLSILVAVGVIFGFVTLGKMFVADMHAGSALKARYANEFDKSSEKFMKAVSMNSQEGRYFTIISQYGLDLANIELAKGEDADKNKIQGYITSAAGAAVSGRNLMPNDVFANETAGFILENSGGYIPNALEESKSAYERARNLEPQNPYFDIAIGKLKLIEAQSKSGEEATAEKTAILNEAKTNFESAIEKTTFSEDGQEYSIFAAPYYYLAITQEALGNKDEAIDSMKTALRIVQMDRTLTQNQSLSRQINYGFNLARLLQGRGTDEDNKMAEAILLDIIGVNDKEVNSHLDLGLLYERTDRKDKAIEEYKKILEILPEDDQKARDSIQGLIDTINQGGSNVTSGERTQGNVDEMVKGEGADTGEQEPVDEVTEQDMEILIVKGIDSQESIDASENTLRQKGYKVTVKNEDKEYTGVVILYNGNTDKAEVQKVQDVISMDFNDVTAERDDEQTSNYGNDIVVVIGKSETQNDEAPVEELNVEEDVDNEEAPRE